MPDSLTKIAEGFEIQQKWCLELGSPLTAYICQQAALHIETNTLLADIMLGFANDMRGAAAALRFTGAVHALVLHGKAPHLHSWYESGSQDFSQLWPQIELLIENHFEFFKQFVTEAPQTNEVGRSAVLLAAFSEIAKHIDLPMALYELGASAGLNLLFDQFHYQMNGQVWGDEKSAVRLAPKWQGSDVDLDFKLNVIERNGCDLNPLDIYDEHQLLNLRAYIWPDMQQRQQRFEAAVKLVKSHNVHVERADAALWLKTNLQNLQNGVAHIIYHTIAWQYFPQQVKDELEAMIGAAGVKATKDKPLVHLSFEFNYATGADISYRLWDGETHQGTQFKLGKAHPHGAEIEWLP